VGRLLHAEYLPAALSMPSAAASGIEPACQGGAVHALATRLLSAAGVVFLLMNFVHKQNAYLYLSGTSPQQRRATLRTQRKRHSHTRPTGPTGPTRPSPRPAPAAAGSGGSSQRGESCCAFCGQGAGAGAAGSEECGALLPFEHASGGRGWAHEGCAKWAPNVYEASAGFGGGPSKKKKKKKKKKRGQHFYIQRALPIQCKQGYCCPSSGGLLRGKGIGSGRQLAGLSFLGQRNEARGALAPWRFER
jgi:hypothetical protein